jgi:hypothetical protein
VGVGRGGEGDGKGHSGGKKVGKPVNKFFGIPPANNFLVFQLQHTTLFPLENKNQLALQILSSSVTFRSYTKNIFCEKIEDM